MKFFKKKKTTPSRLDFSKRLASTGLITEEEIEEAIELTKLHQQGLLDEAGLARLADLYQGSSLAEDYLRCLKEQENWPIYRDARGNLYRISPEEVRGYSLGEEDKHA